MVFWTYLFAFKSQCVLQVNKCYWKTLIYNGPKSSLWYNIWTKNLWIWPQDKNCVQQWCGFKCWSLRQGIIGKMIWDCDILMFYRMIRYYLMIPFSWIFKVQIRSDVDKSCKFTKSKFYEVNSSQYHQNTRRCNGKCKFSQKQVDYIFFFLFY